MVNFHFETEATIETEEYIDWLQSKIALLQAPIEEINIVVCTDEQLLKVNQEQLQHDYYTDIITFDYRENNKKDPLWCDLYISIDRVKENAKELKISFNQELKRVLIHGILHQIGYNDKTPEEQKAMRAKENELLNL